MKKVLVAYVSGHGFGHFTRSEAVLSLVAKEGVPVHVRTNDRALMLARRARWAASVTEVDVGPGIVQRGPIELDLDATEEALAQHVDGLERSATAEADAIRSLGASLVYGDVPPLAFEAASRAKLEAVGLANFPWSWIYDNYKKDRPIFASLAMRLAEAEARATLLLAPPFSGGLNRFPRRERVPLVVRAPTRSREAARKLLPLPAGERRRVVLLSFGGFGDGIDLARAARANPGFFFVCFANPKETAENLAALPIDHDLPHQDLVLAADALLGKPGYGTVAEAVLSRRTFVLTPRGDFREFPILVRAIASHLPHASLSVEQLLEGWWTPALESAFAMPAPTTAIRTDGAAFCARRVLRMVERAARTS
ncbi:hypothetical protein HY251_19145 [bacterium]|nr:hypothetical protein [bacterium]